MSLQQNQPSRSDSIDEQLSLFSIAYARDKAWSQTLELTLSDDDRRGQIINERDARVTTFAQTLVRPPKVSIRFLLRMIRILERGDTPMRIRILSD